MTNKIRNILATAVAACVASSGFAAPYVYDEAYGIAVNGAVAGEKQGFSATVLDDINSDGYKDFAVSAPYATVSSLAQVGKVYIRSGKTGAVLTTISGVADANTRFGWSLANAGDVNGDGKSDLIVGSPYEDSNTTSTGINDVGVVRVYSGASLTASPTVLKTVTGTVIGQNTGYAVTSLGDISILSSTATLASTASTSLKVASVAGLVVGQQVQAVGIAGVVTITAINASTLTLTLSAPVTVALNAAVKFYDATLKLTTTTTSASTNSTSLQVASLSNVVVGQQVLAAGITGFVTVKAVDTASLTVTLDSPVSVATSAAVGFLNTKADYAYSVPGHKSASILSTTAAVAASNSITVTVASVAGVLVGQEFVATTTSAGTIPTTGFPASVKVAAVDVGTKVVTLSAPVTVAAGAFVKFFNVLGQVSIYNGGTGVQFKTLTGGANSGYGQSIAGVMDMNADGRRDLLVGSPLADRVTPTSAADAGKAELFVSLGVAGSAVNKTVWGLAAGDQLGYQVASAGADLPINDVTDGVGDFLVSAPYADTASNTDIGKIYMVSGASGGIFNTVYPAGQPGEVNVQFGKNNIAYVGDGFGNLYMSGMPFRNAMTVAGAGSVGIFNEYIAELVDQHNGDWRVGATANDNAGQAVAGPSDGKIGDGECPLFLYTTPGYDLPGLTDVGQIFFLGDCDTDSDQLGDRTDKWPTNPVASIDTDSDGKPDEWTKFAIDNNLCLPDATTCGSPLLTLDTDDDNDGVADDIDAFPLNSAASIDTDHDGKADSWAPGNIYNCAPAATTCNGLTVDIDDDNDGLIDSEEAALFTSPINLLDPPHISNGVQFTLGLEDTNFATSTNITATIWEASSGQVLGVAPIDKSTVDIASAIFDNGPAFVLGNTGVRICNGDPNCTLTLPMDNGFKLSGYAKHVCGVSSTSGVQCVGTGEPADDFGQVTVPARFANVSGVLDVAAGGKHSCAVDAAGVMCWGDDTYHQVTPFSPQIAPIMPTAVAAGDKHTCAIDNSAEKVTCWGDAANNKLAVPNTVTSPLTIVAGSDHTCVLNGSYASPESLQVVCWGKGQTGLPVIGLTNPVSVSAGGAQSCAVQAKGLENQPAETITTCWPIDLDFDGDGVGNSEDTDDDADGILDANETSAYLFDTDNDGIVNSLDPDDDADTVTDYDELFHSVDNCRLVSNIDQLDTDSDGQGDACDLDDDNDGLTDVEEAAAGSNALIADTDADTVGDFNEVIWGMDPNNANDLSGDADGDGLSNEHEIAIGTNPGNTDSDGDALYDGWEDMYGRNPLWPDYQVSAGMYHTCALADPDATHPSGISCWGRDQYGQTQVPEAQLSAPIQVSAGGAHTCALDVDTAGNRSVKCWGDNSLGQAPAVVLEPVLVNPQFVSAGTWHTCALDKIAADTTAVKCWGYSYEGATVVPELYNPTQLSSRGLHSCALDANGVHCWGRNDEGQTNVPPLSNVVSIDTNYMDTCAVHDHSDVTCWGLDGEYESSQLTAANFYHLASTPPKTAMGWLHSCAISVDQYKTNVLSCYTGNNYYGVMDIPANSNPVQVSSGLRHSCALDDSGLFCWGAGTEGQTRDEDFGQSIVPEINVDIYRYEGTAYRPLLTEENAATAFYYDLNADGNLDVSFEHNGQVVVEYGTAAGSFLFPTVGQYLDPATVAADHHLINRITFGATPDLLMSMQYTTPTQFKDAQLNANNSNDELYLAIANWLAGRVFALATEFDDFSYALEYNNQGATHNVYRSTNHNEVDTNLVWVVDGVSAGTAVTVFQKSLTVDSGTHTIWLAHAGAESTPLSNTVTLKSTVDLASFKTSHDGMSPSEVDQFFGQDALTSTVGLSADVHISSNASTNTDDYTVKMLSSGYMGTFLREYQVLHMIHSENQLQEVLGWFWENHFNTQMGLGNGIGGYELLLRMNSDNSPMVTQGGVFKNVYSTVLADRAIVIDWNADNDIDCIGGGTNPNGKIAYPGITVCLPGDANYQQEDWNLPADGIVDAYDLQDAYDHWGLYPNANALPGDRLGIQLPQLGKDEVEAQQIILQSQVYSRRYMAEYWDNKKYRAHALGSFQTLLNDSMTSPSMMTYLSNSVNNQAACDAGTPPNENYGREIMELHTLGAMTGYSEGLHSDIEMVSQALTGWGVVKDANTGGGVWAVGVADIFDHWLQPDQNMQFAFKETEHQCFENENTQTPPKHYEGIDNPVWDGSKSKLKGHLSNAATTGQAEGLAVQHVLATSPYTGRFICSKLGQVLVTDQVIVAEKTGTGYWNSLTGTGADTVNGYPAWPEPTHVFQYVTPVEACYDAFMASTGNIKLSVDAMLSDAQFNNYQQSKIKTPLEMEVATVRNQKRNWVEAGYPINYRTTADWTNLMGLSLFDFQEPTGWAENSARWLGVESISNRFVYTTLTLDNRRGDIPLSYYDESSSSYVLTNYADNFILLGARTGSDVYQLMKEVALSDQASAAEETNVAPFKDDFELATDPDAEEKLRQLLYYIYTTPTAQYQ